MTSVRSFSEVLLDTRKLSDEQRNRFVSIIYEESKRLTRLLDEILDLNRLESGEESLNLREVDAAAIVHEAASAMLGFAHQHGIEIVEGRAGAPPAIAADPDRLKQVVINLIHNAIKFNDRAGGEVRVSTDTRGDWLVVAVEDNGPGVAEADRQAIFEKFSRRDLEREGSGLGLAICKRIIERHGGRIWVESELEKGSCFCFTLPKRATK